MNHLKKESQSDVVYQLSEKLQHEDKENIRDMQESISKSVIVSNFNSFKPFDPDELIKRLAAPQTDSAIEPVHRESEDFSSPVLLGGDGSPVFPSLNLLGDSRENPAEYDFFE
jgi:hypothetical protein